MPRDLDQVLDRDTLLELARENAGLTDFGDSDFEEAFDRYLAGLRTEARLSEQGVMGTQLSLTRLLVNRLRIQDAVSSDPSLSQEPVTDPVIIIGMPRSGTTKLHRMMARDRRFQSLPLWRILNPVPLGPTSESEPRVEIAREFVEAMQQASPDFAAAHPMDALEVDEEEFLMEHTFLTYAAFYQARIPSYQAWVLDQDFDRWYREFKDLLRLMQREDHATGRRWLLKAPSHTAHLDKIFEYFPDATILHCHRDPRSVTPSLCGLIRSVRTLTSDRVDLPEIGRWALDHWPPLLDAHMEQRDRWVSVGKSIVDVAYSDLVADAVSVVRRVYESADIVLEEPALEAMRDWEGGNPQHKHGRHKYSLEEYGLTELTIDRAFAVYADRFGDLW